MKQSTRKYRGFTIFHDIGTYHSYADENGIRTFLPSHTTIREAKQEIDKHLGPKGKNQKGFKPGDEVKKEMGVRMEGIVSVPFHWKDSTDGTYKEPGKGDIPICWNDGTCGYCHKSYLVKLSTLR